MAHYEAKKEAGPSYVLGICGVIVLLGGLFFLFADPGEATAMGQVVNLHKVIIGQTLTVCGTILIAVQWRPR
jgi:hypothetical protein